jgi:hypothetical protein
VKSLRAITLVAAGGMLGVVLLFALGVDVRAPGGSGDAQTTSVRPAGVLRDPIDPEQQLAVAWNQRSHWLQPWRAYLETIPSRRVRDALGVQFNVEPEEAFATARLLASAGFNRARVEINWDRFRYESPTTLSDPGHYRRLLLALKRNGIRPLILLNAHHGAPCPTRFFQVRLTASARRGSRSIRLDPASAAAVVPGRTGLVEEGKAAGILFTAVSADGTVTLSRPLPRDFGAGQHPAATLLYKPFERPLQSDGSANPDFEATLSGWLNYSAAASRFAHEVLGSWEFDVEIWNELAFGSDFLDLNSYYDPNQNTGSGTTTDTILRRTVAWLRDPAQGLGPIGIGNGFANTRPWDAGSTSPPGLTAIDKHPYPTPKAFPDGATYDGAQPLDALGQPDGDRDAEGNWRDRFVPTYVAFFPEYYLTAIQTEHIVRDLSPFTTEVEEVTHGRATNPDGTASPQVWITELNLDPRAIATDDPQGAITAAERRIQAKGVLRALVAYVNKGVTAFHIYAAKDDGLGIIQPSFFRALEQGRYPGDRAGGITINALRRLLDELGPGSAAVASRQLRLLAVADYEGQTQFDGDGSPAHPSLGNRDVLAFFPFQASRSKYVIATYVMTRNVAESLRADRFRLTIGNVGACKLSVSANRLAAPPHARRRALAGSYAEIDVFEGIESVAFHQLLAELARVVIDPRHEACLLEPLRVIAPIHANVVELPEVPLPILRARDRRILSRPLEVGPEAGLQERPSPWAKDPVELPQRFAIVLDVLENVVADDHVERLIVERNLCDIQLDRDIVGEQISCHVADRVRSLERAPELGLGSDVKHVLRNGVEIGLFSQIEPLKPMTLERVAREAARIRPWLYTEGRETTKRCAAAGALHVVARVGETPRSWPQPSVDETPRGRSEPSRNDLATVPEH